MYINVLIIENLDIKKIHFITHMENTLVETTVQLLLCFFLILFLGVELLLCCVVYV